MVDASEASSQSFGGYGINEYVKFPSPSGSVALNSPITVPIAEFSAMARLLALISLGGRLLELASHGSEL